MGGRGGGNGGHAVEGIGNGGMKSSSYIVITIHIYKSSRVPYSDHAIYYIYIERALLGQLRHVSNICSMLQRISLPYIVITIHIYKSSLVPYADHAIYDMGWLRAVGSLKL